MWMEGVGSIKQLFLIFNLLLFPTKRGCEIDNWLDNCNSHETREASAQVHGKHIKQNRFLQLLI